MVLILDTGDPTACYRADNELKICINKIRYSIHILSSLTQSYFLSEIEAEELVWCDV
jgi:hypothetical protein